MSGDLDGGDEYWQLPWPGLAGGSESGSTGFTNRDRCYLFLDVEAYNKIIEDHPRIAVKIVTSIASLIQNRAERTRRTMYHNLIKESPNASVGISRLGRWLGKWTRVSEDMSKRLFGSFEGENFNSQAGGWLSFDPNKVTPPFLCPLVSLYSPSTSLDMMLR